MVACFGTLGCAAAMKSARTAARWLPLVSHAPQRDCVFYSTLFSKAYQNNNQPFSCCSSAQTDVAFSATHIFHVFYFDASILLSIRPAALHLNKHAKRKRVLRNWHRTLWSASQWINCRNCCYHLTENYSNLLHTSAWHKMHFTNADNVIEVFIFPLYSW